MAKGDVLIRMKADVSNYDANIAKARKSLTDFKEANLTMGGAIKSAAITLTKFAGGFSAVSAAVKVAKDAFMQSESGIDEWGRTVEGAKGAYNVFLDTLNNGNWSNFFENLQTAIKGGRDLYDIFDRLGSIKSNNAAAIAIVQQQIAQLRLAKQQGENVDAQLKEATARLAQLQKQSITAGKSAGSKSAFEVIRNGVNSVGGAAVNDATINYVVDRIMKSGQSEFDKYNSIYQKLEKKGTYVEVIPGVGYDSQGNENPDQRKQSFDINLLTKEQQKQYAIAKAVTEGETRIQKGIAAYAQAVQEGTASAREEFKGNRYAMTGRGGGVRSGIGKQERLNAEYMSGTGINTYRSRSSLQEELQRQQVAMDNATNVFDAQAAQSRISDLQWQLSDEGRQAAKIGFDRDSLREMAETMAESLGNVEGLKFERVEKSMSMSFEDFSDSLRERVDLLSGLSGGMNSIVGGLQQLGIEIPEGIQKTIGVMQALVSILTGISAVVSIIATISGIKATPFIGWLLHTGGVVHAAGGYRVPGNYGYDAVPAMLTSGETVLTRAQAGNLASQLAERNSGQSMQPFVDGETIFLGMNNTSRRMGRGEIVTTSTLRRLGLI